MEKNKEVRSIECVVMHMTNFIAENKLSLEEYCEQYLGLTKPQILIPKILQRTLFNINGFPMHLTGRTGVQLTFAPAVQIHLEDADKAYFKKITKFYARKIKNPEATITSFDEITKAQNETFYELLLNKHKESLYILRPGSQLTKVEQGQNIFKGLSLEKQCEAIFKLMQYFSCSSNTSDLTLIGGEANAGKSRKAKKLKPSEKPRIIYQSVTGLFDREIDLFSL